MVRSVKKLWIVAIVAALSVSFVDVAAAEKHATVTVSAAGDAPFKDVPADHWAASVIRTAVSKGYVSGYPDGTFRPDQNVTRAEFMKMLVSALELSHETEGSPWYQPYVAALTEAGVFVKSDFSDFKAPISRLEIMRLTARGLAMDIHYRGYLEAFSGLYNGDLPYVDYRDLKDADVPYAALAIGSGILAGYPDITMGLSKNATRAEAVAMIERLLKVKSKAPESFQALRELKEVAETGTNATTVSSLVPEINLQEEEVVTVTQNYTVKLKRYYVIPLEGDVVSIYERKFLWDRYDVPEHLFNRARGYVAVVTDLTPTKDGDQEYFRLNTYVTPGGNTFYYNTPSEKFGFIHPWPAERVEVKKGVTYEVVFYGVYSNDYFGVNFQSNNFISGGGFRLLFNPDKLKARESE